MSFPKFLPGEPPPAMSIAWLNAQTPLLTIAPVQRADPADPAIADLQRSIGDRRDARVAAGAAAEIRHAVEHQRTAGASRVSATGFVPSWNAVVIAALVTVSVEALEPLLVTTPPPYTGIGTDALKPFKSSAPLTEIAEFADSAVAEPTRNVPALPPIV